MLPEVMIPLIGTVEELKMMKDVCVEMADQVMEEMGVKFDYLVGTMMEIPRACVVADEIATEAEFFSFGTNDLTQMTFGFSRDDAGTFLPEYVEKDILPRDPFQSLDQVGVGALVQMGVEKAAREVQFEGRRLRRTRRRPCIYRFLPSCWLGYVSCSPYRVPIARLAAAQANIRNPR